MNKTTDKGFVAVDMTIAVIAIMIFSILILSLITYNFLENLKVRRDTLAIIYLTEALENIGIATYEDVTQENSDSFIPSDLESDNYKMDITINNNFDLSEENSQDIIKKVLVTISYEIGDKKYQHNMERIKIKE